MEWPAYPEQNTGGVLEGIFQGDVKESKVIYQVAMPAKEVAQILNAHSSSQSCHPGT